MPDPQPNQDGGTTGLTPARQGVVIPLTSSRKMKCHILTEFEIDGLSNMNGSCTFSVGLSTAFLGIALGMRTSKEFADPKAISATGEILAGPGANLAFALAIVFAVAAVISYFRARGALKRIKDESKETEQPNAS